VQSAYLHALTLELTHQHALAHEGVLQVQLINLANEPPYSASKSPMSSPTP